MVSVDLGFISKLIEDIVEYEGAIWNERSLSLLSINRGSYHVNRVQVVDGEFFPCASVFFGAAYCWEGPRSVSYVWLPFLCVLSKQNSKPKKQDCIQT